MPQVSTAPLFNSIAHITGDHVFAPSDTFASIKTMPGGGLTVWLPGPSAPVPPGNPKVPNPSDGDFYEVADPHGLISGGNPLVVEGGGFPIAISGAPSSVTSVGAFSVARFTFDDDAQRWIACLCEWQLPD